MLTQTLISPHRQRSRTRSTAFLLAITLFTAVKLISNGAVNVSRASEIEGMQMLDVECGSDQSVRC
jgi:predicted HTH domain antitoxin